MLNLSNDIVMLCHECYSGRDEVQDFIHEAGSTQQMSIHYNLSATKNLS